VADLRSHARHDRFAISAALGGGGALPGTVLSCPACGALHSDLLVIRDAIRGAWLPQRPRDLRLSAVTAARLRPSGWRRLVRAIGSSRDAISRPLGLSLVGLGLAGLLLTAVPMVSFPFGSAGAIRPESRTMAVQAPVSGAIGITGQPSVSSPDNVDRELAEPAAAPSDDRLLVLSAALLTSGGALLIVRRLATRSAAMP
jgi:hypothetical protein